MVDKLLISGELSTMLGARKYIISYKRVALGVDQVFGKIYSGINTVTPHQLR